MDRSRFSGSGHWHMLILPRYCYTVDINLLLYSGGTVCVYINTVGPLPCILTRWDRFRVY